MSGIPTGGRYKCGTPQDPFASEDEVLDKTGFPSPNSLPLLVTPSFSDSTPDRTFTLTPTAASFDFWQANVKYTKVGAQSIQIPNEVGLFVFYYDGGTLAYIKNPTDAQKDVAIRIYAIVAYVYWDGTAHNYLAYEAHGFNMSGDTHSNIHFTQGAQWVTGLELNTLDVDGNGNDATAAQFGVGLGITTDEDLINMSSAIAGTTGLPIFYLDGATPTMKRVTVAGYSVYKGTNRLYFNEYSGGSWSLTEVGLNNDLMLCHVFGSNDKAQPIVAIMGQAEYANKRQARAGAEVEISTILTEFPQEEMVPLATVIFQTNSSWGNAVSAKVISTADGDDYVDWRQNELKAGASPTAPAAHAISHQVGGSDEVDVTDLSGLLADAQVALAHKTGHEDGGGDEISVAGLTGLLATAQNPVSHDNTEHDVDYIQSTTTAKITVASSAPGTPDDDDLWIDIS